MRYLNTLEELGNHEDVSPANIESSLSLFIRQYFIRESKAQAQAIVKLLETLLGHPDCIGFPDHRCSYMKMLQQWKAITMRTEI